MSTEKYSGLLRLFKMLDTDGNGSISLMELKHGLGLFGLKEEQIAQIQAQLDLNKDEEITLDEYKLRLGIPFEDTDEISSGKRFPRKGRLMTLFAKLDHNKDAHISKTELLEELRKTGMEESQIQEVFAYLDLDGDGLISLGEYKVALGLTYEKLEDWKKLFDEIDADRSGDITVDELERLVKKDRLPITRSAITEWIHDHDRNHDGKLNFKEFFTFVGKQAERAFP